MRRQLGDPGWRSVLHAAAQEACAAIGSGEASKLVVTLGDGPLLPLLAARAGAPAVVAVQPQGRQRALTSAAAEANCLGCEVKTCVSLFHLA